MEVTKELSKAAVEVLDILRYCSDDVLNKIPQKFIDYLNDIQSFDYVFEYDKTKKLEDQNLSPQAYYIIGLIYKDYICDDKERLDYLRELNKFKQEDIASKNEKYPIEKLFKNTSNMSNEEYTEKSIIKVEEVKWYKKLFNKIKSLFKGNKSHG